MADSFLFIEILLVPLYTAHDNPYLLYKILWKLLRSFGKSGISFNGITPTLILIQRILRIMIRVSIIEVTGLRISHQSLSSYSATLTKILIRKKKLQLKCRSAVSETYCNKATTSWETLSQWKFLT